MCKNISSCLDGLKWHTYRYITIYIIDILLNLILCKAYSLLNSKIVIFINKPIKVILTELKTNVLEEKKNLFVLSYSAKYDVKTFSNIKTCL